MNLSEIRARARDILYMEADEFPNTLIDMFAEDGFRRIITTDRRWPFYQSLVTLTTVVGQQTYSLASGMSSELTEVSGIWSDDTGDLTAIPFFDGMKAYGFTDSGTPQAFSVWNDIIYLWPKPDAILSLYVTGYRPYTEWWTDAATEIDCAEDFHMCLLYYVLSRAYGQLEDTEMAAYWEDLFVTGAANASRQVMKRNSGDYPLIMSGGTAGGSGGMLDWRVLID